MTTTTTPLNPKRAARLAAVALLAAAGSAAALAQKYPITPGQRATAQQVAEAGVPLSELAPNAPDHYVVKKGDTLWAISGLFLKSPWRWPELWGMNLQDIRNPHLIYPGQELYLERSGDRARLRFGRGEGVMQQAAPEPPPPVERLSPHVRATPLDERGIPPLPPNLIEPFLADALIVDQATIDAAPRIVAAQEGRVMLGRGDRAYVRGMNTGGEYFRIFREARPITDPGTGAVLGHEAQLVGRAQLVRPEATRQRKQDNGETVTDIEPGTIDLLDVKEEIRAGDRLLPEPPREFPRYVPHAPESPVDGQIAAIHGSAVRFAAQGQVVLLNRGSRDGLERGHVLAILKTGERLVDKTDPRKATIKLPDERNGLLMVFRAFDRVSYALLLQITDGVKVGDRVVNPR